ncbi:MAG: zinc-dependent peptidase [Burkholderiales bacterium]|jgi:Mlc titration factor MtfA (ptsG expression regulator)
MLGAYRAWRRRRILGKHSLDPLLWQRVSSRYSYVARLNETDRRRLRDLCVLFLHEKQISPVNGFELDADMRLSIAVQACILILNLGLDSYSDWVEVIVYPDEFMPRGEFRDEHGLVHTDPHAYAGQAWSRGPVILSWRSIETGSRHDGGNVVIHEFAHKLDMLNGSADGYPMLHREMNRETWARIFTHAYEDLRSRVVQGRERYLDEYATESPAEFFAVVSESFFEQPELLLRHYPDIYDQLAQFYRQNPANALPGVMFQ